MTSRAQRFVVEVGNDRPTVRPLGTLRDRPSDPDAPLLEVEPLAVSELRDALRIGPRLRPRATKPMRRPPKNADAPADGERSGVLLIAKTKRDPVTEELVVLSEHDPRPER